MIYDYMCCDVSALMKQFVCRVCLGGEWFYVGGVVHVEGSEKTDNGYAAQSAPRSPA